MQTTFQIYHKFQHKFQTRPLATWPMAYCLFSQHKEEKREVIICITTDFKDEIRDWGSVPTQNLLQVVIVLMENH